jgi:hypothetical protein
MGLAAIAVLAVSALSGPVARTRPLGTIGAADLERAPPRVQDRTGTFLENRDTVEIVVDRSISRGALIDLYRIGFRHVPAQIAAQTHPPALSDEAMLIQGRCCAFH